MSSWIASGAVARPARTSEIVGSMSGGRSKYSDRFPCGSMSIASVRTPLRRSTSARVRTVVVLPVPPFWERTAIVMLIDAILRALARRGRDDVVAVPGALLSDRMQTGVADPAAVDLRFQRRDRDEHQAVAPDDDLVPVAERAAVDAGAVDEHAVEAAVVEQPHPVGLAHDQRVPARDGGVVEAHVGRQT